MTKQTQHTASVKAAGRKRQWHLIDATDLVLGRLASVAAVLLRGKHYPDYTPHVDCGDYVVIINAEKVHLTGRNKAADKTYYHHTGYPGGIKGITAQKILEGSHPQRVVHKAIQRMISRNKLGNVQMAKLFVYAGQQHKHEAQKPVKFDVAGMNPKNSKRS